MTRAAVAALSIAITITMLLDAGSAAVRHLADWTDGPSSGNFSKTAGQQSDSVAEATRPHLSIAVLLLCQEMHIIRACLQEEGIRIQRMIVGGEGDADTVVAFGLDLIIRKGDQAKEYG